jgi:hypothetical protein
MLSNKHTNWKKTGLLIADAILIFNMIFSECNLAQAYTSNSFGFGDGTGGFSIPEPISVVDDVLTKFNLSTSSVAEMSQQFNVSEQKTSFPQVSIFFDPSDPKAGKKITAQASSMYFSSAEEKLYFTWYIKHKKNADGKHGLEQCEKKEYDENCDWNGKDGIDEEDWKIEAMRIIAQAGYDKNSDEPEPDYGNDNDSDGYFAPLGGGDKTEDEDNEESTPSYCYIGDFSSGTKYKVGETSNTESKADYELSCPSGSSAYCLKTSSDTCLGREITEELEKCELVNNSMTPTCTMADGTSGTPECVDDDVSDDANLFSSGVFKYKRVFTNSDPAGYTESCKYGNKKCFDIVSNDECFETTSTYDPSTGYTETLDDETVTCNGFADRDAYSINDWDDFMTGKGKSLSGFGCGYSAEDYQTLSTPTCTLTGEEYDGDGCEHLFPDTGNDDWEAGDGEFEGNEEKFWGTNPQDPNTAGNGNLDEANVSGLGQKQFSWIFQEEDKVGVIVEGTSMLPTKYEDGSYAIMWALPKNIFHIEDEDSETGYAKGFAFNVPTADNTINKSLEDNLVDPAEKRNDKLEVTLSYTPENPMNDPSGDGMGDILSVNSIVNNASQNSSQLYYEWEISAGKNTSNLKKIPDDLVEGKLKGISNSSISIKMGLSKDYFDNDGMGYLKISNKAKESAARIGRTEEIIRINSSDKKIKAYLTTSEDGKNLKKGSMICGKNSTAEEKLSYYICPVVKNQILRLEVEKDGTTDLAWKVSGSSYICDNDISSDCSSGNVIFLPIAGNEGDNISVAVSGKNLDNGKSIELAKSFQIVKPYVRIISDDSDVFWPKALGAYTDLDGKQYPDYSDDLFETYNGMENVPLKAEFHPNWLLNTGLVSAQWFIDGEDVTNSENPQEIKFDINKEIGETYNVDFKSLYASSNEIRKVLKNYWGISQEKSNGEILAHSINSEVVEMNNPAGTSLLNKSGKFLANIVSNLPSQAVFLLRMALVVFVVVFMSGLAMNFSPDFRKK